MINRKEITNRISQLSSLKELIGTYEEIAALRMRKIRSSVLQAREFNNGLGSIFHEVKDSHIAQIKSIMKQNKITDKKSVSLIHKNNKTVAVFLSANTRLYGDIIQKTYEQFMGYVRKDSTADIVIIGRVGREIFSDENPNTVFTYFNFPDTNTPKEDIAKLTQHLIQYEKIYIFYGKFESVTSQKPTALDVYGKENQPEIESDSGPRMKYLFEPSLEEVMVYFESEIFASIVSQALNESELAKYAARMITLDATTENVKNDLKKVSLQKRILLHRQTNKKQVESLIGMSLWRR